MHLTNNPDDTSGVGEEYAKIFDKFYIARVSQETTPLFDGIKELLMELSKRSLRMGALSNACGEYVRAVAQANDIDACMEIWIGADEVPAPKPKPDGLLSMTQKMGLDPRKCIYVGDAPTDGAAAANAKFGHSVGCTWGSHTTAAVIPAFDHVAHSVEELRMILLQLTGASN